MTRLDFDIAICGAGPVGCVLALLLHHHNPSTRIALFGQKPPPHGSQLDPRTLALNHGSRQLLEQLQVWPTRSAPIHTVHVSQQGRLGRTLITPDELDVNLLGSVVNYDDLLHDLRQAVQQSAIHYVEVDAPTRTCAQSNPYAVIQADAKQYTTAIAVQSGGLRPDQLKREYNQHALLATVQSSHPKKDWAFERFTASGPLALLPHPNQADCYALVWCNPPARTTALQHMERRAFNAELMQAFGARLGNLDLISQRFEFPLALAAGPSLPAPYTVALGNAAQTLHPVAGQGLNLGLRDTAQLALSLRPWLANPDTDPTSALHHYAQQRKPDRWLTGTVTDFLPRVFATNNPLIQHACGLGLLGMDLLALARQPLARQLLQGLRI